MRTTNLLALSEAQKKVFSDYFKEVEKIKYLKINAEKLKNAAENNKVEAGIMLNEQIAIANALRNIEFNKLKAEFQDIMITFKKEIISENAMSIYPIVMGYTFAEGASMAYNDLKNVLIELNVFEKK